MPENIRALIVILALATATFYVNYRFSKSLVSRNEFKTWIVAWFAVTIVSFLSGNFFISTVAVASVCFYVFSIRTASVALFFILVFALPPVRVEIGGLSILNSLIEMDVARLLSIFLLLPILLSSAGDTRGKNQRYALADSIIIGYVVLKIILEFRRSEFTNVLRVATEYMLDILIPYFAFSRTVKDISEFRKVLFAFVVAVVPLALIAVFEAAKSWRLYETLAQDWGGNAGGYLRRNDVVRAGASAGSIVLGYLIMVAIGCLLAVRSAISSPRLVSGIVAIFIGGFVATLSRGPWVGAMVLVIVYLATGPRASSAIIKFISIGGVMAVLLSITPAGDRLLNLLPFVGTGDAGTVEYRQGLFDTAIEVIKRNPWFGSTDYLSSPEMRALIERYHFVDIVNTYLRVALETGFVGLALFLVMFFAILRRLWSLRSFRFGANSDIEMCIRASMAILASVLVTIGTVSSIQFIPVVYWSFAGLSVALIRIASKERSPTSHVFQRTTFRARVSQ